MAKAPMFRSMRHRNAQLFFLGLTVSSIGTWMQFTAMAVLVYRLTGKATDVGITLFCQFLPMLLLGAWAGAVADRHVKRLLTILTQSLLAVQALLLGILVLAGVVNLPLVYGLSLLLGVINAFDNPARRGFVLELVEPADYSNVMSLNTAVLTGSRVFGPALATLLVGVAGPGWLFVGNGVSFLAILWPLLRIDTSSLRIAPVLARGGTPVRDALRFVRSDKRLLVLYVVFTIVGTFAFNYAVSYLKLADQRFHNKSYFGWLLAISSVGNVIGALIAASRPRLGPRIFFISTLIVGVCGFGVAFAPNIWLALLITVPLGAGNAGFVSALNGITQDESPPDMRSRLLALGTVAFLGTTPIGAPITGWIADHVSAEWSLAYGSVVALVAVGIGWLFRQHMHEEPARGDVASPAVVG